MPTLRFPLVGSLTNRVQGPVADGKEQIFTNCYPEINTNPITGKKTVHLLKRFGYSSTSAFTGVSAPNTGSIIVWTGNTSATSPVAAGFTNTGSTSTSVWNLTNGTKIGGDIATTDICACLTETSISGTANLLGYFRDSGTGAMEQWYFPQGGAWTQTTDGDFPTNIVGRPALMDGFVFNMTLDGKLYNSDLNSVSSYAATSYIANNDYPDQGVSVARLDKYIIGFGQKSMEIYQNAGNAIGSPLRRIQTVQMGACKTNNSGPQTVLEAFGTVFWIGTSSNGAITGIYLFEGLTPKKISTPGIDKLISDTGLAGFVGSLMLHGMRHIMLVNTAGTAMRAYCLDTNFWWAFQFANGSASMGSCAESGGAGLGNFSYFTIGTTGTVFDFDVNQDAGADFTMSVQTDNMDVDTDRRKFWKKIRLAYDRQSSTSNLGISYSDDDFVSYSTARNIDMSGNLSWLARLGSSSRRSWKFTNTANTPCRIQAVEIDYDVGQS